jgi:hypothetical protein
MKTGRTPKRIGLAIVGAGRIGLIRGEISVRHGNVDSIAVAETRADRGKEVATKALDLSARRKRSVSLPITPEDERG